MTLSATLFWDGIYNVTCDGALTSPAYLCNAPLLVPPPQLEPFERDLPIAFDVGYARPRGEREERPPIIATLKAWTVGMVSASDADVETALNSITLHQITVRVGDRDDDGTRLGVPAEFLPYEDLLRIPIHLQRAELIKSLMLRVFRGVKTKPDTAAQAKDDRKDRDGVHLVYQELFDAEAVAKLLYMSPAWRESDEQRATRQAQYWGEECFANWYHHTYTIELWASVEAGAFDLCDGTSHPAESRAGKVHNHSMPRYSNEWDRAHASWSYAMQFRVSQDEEGFKARVEERKNATLDDQQPEFVTALGYNVTVAADVIHQAYNYDNKREHFEWLDDYSRIQRLLRNKPKLTAHLAHLERYLKRKPEAFLSEALEYYEQMVSFPNVQVIPLSVLDGPDFVNLVARAYAIDDIGAGTSHGMWTHRLQWAAISSLITKLFTVGRQESLFYHTPLQLYAKAGFAYGKNDPRTTDTRFPQDIPLWGFLFDRANVPGGIRDRHVEERKDGHLHHPDNFHFNLLGFGLDFAQIEPAFDELSLSPAEDDPYEFAIMIPDSPEDRLVTDRTRAHFWMGRFVERLARVTGKDAPPECLGIRAWTWTVDDEKKKPVGILKRGELASEVEAMIKQGEWAPTHPSVARRLLAIWLELRIAQDCMAAVLRTAIFEKWFNSVDPGALNRIDGVDKYALFPTYPWTIPLRNAAREVEGQLFRRKIGKKGSPIDAILPVGSVDIEKDALDALRSKSERLADPGPRKDFKPAAIQLF